MSQRLLAVGNTVFDLTARDLNLRSPALRDERVTARPTGRSKFRKQQIIAPLRKIDHKQSKKVSFIYERIVFAQVAFFSYSIR